MDKTTLTLAVDSTQVNSASAALQKMAGEGYKAESVVAKLANTAQLQGRALSSGIVKNAAAAADSIKGLTGATSALAGAQDFSKTTSGLAAAAAQANAATSAVQAFGAAIAASASAGANFQVKAPNTTKLEDAVQAPARPVTLTSLTNERLRPLMQQYRADGLPDTEAYEKALKQIDAEWKKYEETAVAAQKAVAAQTAGTANAVAAVAAQVKNTTSEVNALNAAASKGSAPQTAVAAATTNTGAAGAGAAVGANAKQIGAAGDAASKSAKQMDELGFSAKQMAMKHQIAAVQVKDFAEQVLAGGSPMRAFAMQGAAVVSNYGGFSNTLRSLASLLTPVRVALGGTATAVAALGYAFYEGKRQSKEFADAVVLSGNYAGITAGKMDALAKAAAENSKSGIGSAREYAQALIATGEVGPQVMSAATEAAAGFGKATGKAADEVAADFAKMSRSPSKYAEELNRSLNFITAAQLESMKSFEESGRIVDAQAIFYDALNKRLKELEPNVTGLSKVIRDAKNEWSKFWDAATGNGRAETIEDKIAKLDKLAKAGQGALPAGGRAGLGMTAEQSRAFVGANIPAQRAALVAQQEKEQESAIATAQKAQAEKEAIAGGTVIDSYLRRGKAASEYKKKLDELDRSIAARRKVGIVVTSEDEAIARKELKKEFTPAKGAGSNEASQVLRAQYDQQIKGFKDALDKEKEALAFHNQFQQGEYQAGRISLKAFYDDRIASIKDATAKEIAELDKERAATVTLISKTKDPSEKVKAQTKLNEIDQQKEKTSTAGDREVELATQAKTAAFKQLDEAVLSYRANLLQMAGDELGAAKIRAQITEQNALVLATQSGGKITTADVQRQTALTEATNQFADVQRKASDLAQNTSRAEEAANLLAEIGGKSLLETENAVYAVREKALAQLGRLAAKAAELARESKDPKVAQAAADLALAYANAADKLDPALQRLRTMQKDLASSITGTIDNGIANFGQNYLARRQQQQQDASKKGGKDEGGFMSAVKTVGTTVIAPIAGQITATINKTLVTEPLQKYLEVQIRGLTEGDGIFAKFFKDALGIKDPKLDANNAILAQAAAANASATALDVLTNAANNAAGAMGGGNSKPLTVEEGSGRGVPSLGDFTRADRALGDGSAASSDQAAAQATADARAAVDGFSDTTTSAAKDITKLAQAAGQGGGALGMLPSIVSLFQAAVSAMNLSSAASGGSSGGGMVGSIVNLFSNSGSAGSAVAASNASALAPEAADVVTSFIFHKGGVVGGAADSRSAPSSLFAGATRYHTGGIAGKSPDGARAAIASALKHGEVPAILMKNEEVLRRDDPRHRDNLGTDIFAKVMQSKGENSATVLQGLLGRLGVKDDEPAVSSALKVAGARELGGPVSAGKLYRVNEKRPELLNVAGKQYLMMGSQGGKVDANPQTHDQRPVQFITNQHFAPGTDRTTVNQAAAQNAYAARRALSRIS